MDRVLKALDRISTGRNLILSIIASAIVVITMAMLTQTLVYDVYGDALMPDTNFGYTFTEIQTAFDTLGQEGLQVWLQVHLLDLIFPLTYAFAMLFGIILELRAAFPEMQKLKLLVILPLGGAISDYIENALIATQAISYPNLSASVIALASAVTITKWILLYIGFAVIFLLIPLIFYRKFKK
ncbi:MAG: hypothetical protein KAR33_06460 [Candidatus Thorarchaeota archaeon]|nr:hypothetical protein [Candidatus Thorarchaeota archaeon]